IPNFTSIEHKEAIKDINRVLEAIHNEIHHLDKSLRDWSSWDDTVNFIENMDREYIKVNLVDSSFETNEINIMYFYNTSKQSVWGKFYDTHTKQSDNRQLKDFPATLSNKEHPLFRYLDANYLTNNKTPLRDISIPGLMKTEEGIMLIASRPIISSNYEGPIKGALVMGKILANELINAIAKQTKLDIEIRNEAEFTQGDRSIIKKLTKESPYFIEDIDSNQLKVYTTMKDINSKTALMIQVTIATYITSEGKTALHFALMSIVSTGLIILILLMLFLQRVVIAPITKLKNLVISIRQSGNLSKRIDLQYKDEIGVLASEFNLMIDKIESSTTALQHKNEDLIKTQNRLIVANAQIVESIKYASNIQKSVLPTNNTMKESLSDFFIIWEPRDTVGGDIYWYKRWGSGCLLAVADCTGHGVPGAFITLLSRGALDIAMMTVNEGNAAELIINIHKIIQVTLGQNKDGGLSDDGLELGVCYIPHDKKTLTYCGARLSLFCYNGEEVQEIKGSKKPIGYKDIPYDTTFTNYIINIPKRMTFYMTTDGLTEQIGGEKKIAFGKKRLMALIAQGWSYPMDRQRTIIYDTFTQYQGAEERRDDVLVIGFTI
ncbi:MAG: SpoIIE family protein phosphatase, partial [Candidatus Magnetoovum sp. WYHC-5]|nr:SpoIIE family protein phosphatase [Candidatus Magnetoovum sp. WYHC-5]